MDDRPTFEMREGGYPAPSQLKRHEVSRELRALVWHVVFSKIAITDIYDRRYLNDDARPILKRKHIQRDYRPIDEFEWDYDEIVPALKEEFYKSIYPDFYGLVEWFLRNIPTNNFPNYVANALAQARSPFRVVNNDTLVPVGSEHELATLELAFKDAKHAGLAGAQSHLKAAASAATAGRWADCVRDSIHAVEATAIQLAPGAKELGPKLNKLEAKGLLHGGLKNGFKSLYGFTSDEKGIRHSLLEKDESAR